MLITPSNSRRLAKFCVAQFNPAVTVCLFSRLLVPTVLNIFFYHEENDCYIARSLCKADQLAFLSFIVSTKFCLCITLLFI